MADTLTTADLDAMYDRVNNWGKWGPDDERGALNYLTDNVRSSAGSLIKDGASISLGHNLPVAPNVETPNPAHHHMLVSGDCLDNTGIPGYQATGDYIGTQVHGMGITHIDALSHMFVRDRTYNGFLPSDVKSTGALRNTIMSMSEGIVGRGVLLDIPGALGIDYLPPEQSVRTADLLAAEKRQNVTVREGDLLLIATGRDARRAAQKGSLSPFTEGLAGLHPECLDFVYERKIALLGGDGISDHMPFRNIANWPFPIHQIGIVSIGLHLIDNMHLAPGIAACNARARWEFLLCLNPLRIPKGTGCPINPIAVF